MLRTKSFGHQNFLYKVLKHGFYPDQEPYNIVGQSLYLGNWKLFCLPLATSLTDKFLLSNRLWHAFVKPMILSLVGFTVMFIELRLKSVS